MLFNDSRVGVGVRGMVTPNELDVIVGAGSGKMVKMVAMG